MAELRALRAEVAQLRAATPEVLVDLPEAAKVLGVSPRTLRRYVDAGTVAFRRTGRTLRFPLASLKPPALVG